MQKAYDIVVFGDTCVDLIMHDEDVAPRFGQVEKVVAGYELVMGGSCCIFASQAAKLGLKVAVLGGLAMMPSVNLLSIHFIRRVSIHSS